MSKQQPDPGEDFTIGERDYIRRELDMFFSTLPTVAEGFMLKRWKSGPLSGQPKIPLHAQGMIDRGLMRVEAASKPWPRLFFTETGLAALRRLVLNRRHMDAKKFIHIRQELGIDPVPEATGSQDEATGTAMIEKARRRG